MILNRLGQRRRSSLVTSLVLLRPSGKDLVGGFGCVRRCTLQAAHKTDGGGQYQVGVPSDKTDTSRANRSSWYLWM